jgi:hypothetical protein
VLLGHALREMRCEELDGPEELGGLRPFRLSSHPCRERRNGHWGDSNAILHCTPRARQRAVAVGTDETASSREVGGGRGWRTADGARRGAPLPLTRTSNSRRPTLTLLAPSV